MVSENRNRSFLMRERHEFARKQRQFYINKFGESEVPAYREFLKNENPLADKIIAYDVSFQLNYRGNIDNFILDKPLTFRVYGLANQEREIQERTMNMVLDSKGNSTGNNFEAGTLSMIESEGKIQINPQIFPRGMEKSFGRVDRDKALKVIENGFHVEELDKNLSYRNSRNSKGSNELDISHFL